MFQNTLSCVIPCCSWLPGISLHKPQREKANHALKLEMNITVGKDILNLVNYYYYMYVGVLSVL